MELIAIVNFDTFDFHLAVKNKMSKGQKSHEKNSQKIFIRSFGYQMNDTASGVTGRLLGREGYRKIDSPEGVDVIILKNNN